MHPNGSGVHDAGLGRSALALHTVKDLLAGIDPDWNRSTRSGAAAKLSDRNRCNPPADVTTTVLPSGDHRGVLLSTPAGVRRVGVPPLVATIQTSESRLFCDSRTVVT